LKGGNIVLPAIAFLAYAANEVFDGGVSKRMEDVGSILPKDMLAEKKSFPAGSEFMQKVMILHNLSNCKILEPFVAGGFYEIPIYTGVPDAMGRALGRAEVVGLAFMRGQVATEILAVACENLGEMLFRYRQYYK
jgi:hypothetical protein